MPPLSDAGPVTIMNEKSYPQSDQQVVSGSAGQDILNEMKKSRENAIMNSPDRITELQRKLEGKGGASVTLPGASFGNIEPPHLRKISGGDQFNSEIVYSGTSVIKGLATQTQQSFLGAGTIFIAAGFGSLDTGVSSEADTLAIFRSLDNTGNSFSEIARISIGPANKFYPHDAIDMEIIESTDLTSYLYIVYSYAENGYNGVTKCGCAVIRTNPLSVGNFSLTFPGSSYPGNHYFRPRITSDIGTYPVSPYVTIALMQDSVAGNSQFYMSKYCRVLNPKTVNPAFTYMSQSIYVPMGSIDNSPVTYDAQIDLAHVNSGTGVSNKMFFVLSGYPGSENSFTVYKCDATLMSMPYFSYNVNVLLFVADQKELFRVAANDGAGRTTLTGTFANNYQNSGDWDIFYTVIDAAGDGIDTYSMYLLDQSAFYSSRNPDILGRRNTSGSVSVAFKSDDGCNFSHYSAIHIREYTSWYLTIPGIDNEYTNSLASPKPGFRNIPGDSASSTSSGPNIVYSNPGNEIIAGVQLKVSMQGNYDDAVNHNRWDETVKVYLAQSFPPYNLIDSAEEYVCSLNEIGHFFFSNTVTGAYYIVLKHRNSLETWSKTPWAVYEQSIQHIDFTQYATASYGDNAVLVDTSPQTYAMYGGDVNQDGTIDGTDLQLIDNDAYNFVTGFVSTDAWIDYIVDGTDYALADNNAYSFISKIAP
ncbi:MAG: hypothetical protein K1X85_01505 [Ignavibacteria bacterium]|nr:hypothetical protein [Ignavibacteria bacterium]